MHRILPAALVSIVVSAASAQATWLVGPAGLPDIQTAVDVAAPGDEIVIQPGTYAPFWLDKAVVMRAQQPGTVVVTASGLILPYVNFQGGRAHFHGIDWQEMTCSGSDVTFEDCTFGWTGTVVTVNNSVAHFERCRIDALPTFLGGFGPLYVGNSHCSMVDCEVTGMPTGAFLTNSPAIDLQNGGVLLASGCIFRAGPGPSPQPVIRSFGSSVARISDSTFDGPPQLCAISGPGDVVLSRCTLPAPCANVTVGPLLGARASGPITRGLSYSVDFRSEPGMPVLVFGSDELAVTSSPLLAQPFLLSAQGCFPLAALVLDGFGERTLTVAVPNTPLPIGTAVYLQGISGSSYPLLASPVVGGQVR
ncbi:MAG: hypothetical protein KAI24_04810 [Planctomycetes bacterium]|nr:hypothetical protein [Planctomycetota bacterium]